MDAHVECPPGDAVFSITGVFEPIAAMRFHARVAELPLDALVVLDFSHAREVSDLALGVLAAAIAASPHPRIVLRGLTHHHERMLQYLGIDALVLERRDRDDRSGEAAAEP
ncbi:MAG TPA: STAS domain-containing protein [Anaeromyxobacter sp.]